MGEIIVENNQSECRGKFITIFDDTETMEKIVFCTGMQIINPGEDGIDLEERIYLDVCGDIFITELVPVKNVKLKKSQIKI